MCVCATVCVLDCMCVCNYACVGINYGAAIGLLGDQDNRSPEAIVTMNSHG